MSLLRRRALVVLFPVALTVFPPPRSAVAAPAVDAAALAHCAAINAADERLACYDSLARARPNPAPAAAAAPAGVKATPQSAAPGTMPASASAATAAPVAAAAGTTAASTNPAAKSFGLTPHPAPQQGPDRIEAQATRVDTDRLGNVHLSLDNGQIWTFNAPEALIRVGDTITIKRGALGSFLLTTPAHHTYKAQRSQ